MAVTAMPGQKLTADGAAFPNELFTNAGKYHGAANYSLMVRHLHDIAGGSILTVPSPTTVSAVKPNCRPPFTTFATRLIVTSFSSRPSPLLSICAMFKTPVRFHARHPPAP